MAGRQIAVRTAVAEGSWYDSLPRSTKLPTVGGILILAVAMMGFGVWGNMAPIAGAVVASGVFVATGQNKIIQHLEGGVIRDIKGVRRAYRHHRNLAVIGQARGQLERCLRCGSRRPDISVVEMAERLVRTHRGPVVHPGGEIKR